MFIKVFVPQRGAFPRVLTFSGYYHSGVLVGTPQTPLRDSWKSPWLLRVYFEAQHFPIKSNMNPTTLVAFHLVVYQI